MAYTKKVWKDAPDTSTPINAANLNHMENGIAEADVNAQNALDRLDDVDDEITQINSNLSVFKSFTAYISTNLGANIIDVDISSLGFTTAIYNCLCELYANQAVDYTITHEFINVNTIRLYVYTPAIALNNVALSMFIVGR